MKKTKAIFNRIIFYTFIFLVFLFALNTVQLVQTLKHIEQLPDLPEPYEMMRFVVYSYGDNSVSARFWFYDFYGKELASLERAWPADFLQLTFEQVFRNGKSLVYPTQIQNIQFDVKKQSRGTDVRSFVQAHATTHLFSYEKNYAESYASLKAIEDFILKKASPIHIGFLFRPLLVHKTTLPLEHIDRGVTYSVYYENGEICIR